MFFFVIRIFNNKIRKKIYDNSLFIYILLITIILYYNQKVYKKILNIINSL